MAGYSYGRAKQKLLRSVASHFHDKALETNVPETAAKWVALMDACLWAADDDGDPDGIQKLAITRRDGDA